MRSTFLSFINQNSSLLLEYSESFINNFAAKLAKQTNLPGNIEHYKTFIRFFDLRKNTNDLRTYVRDNPNIFSKNNKPITDIGNIESYNAAQLEHIFDQFSTEAQEKKQKHETQQSIVPDADLKFPDSPEKTTRQINPVAVADDRYLEIYFAGNQAKCTHFSHDMFGASYNFCIGRKDASNMYPGYRLRDQKGQGRGAARSFYFVRDYSRPMTDDKHLMVIHALADGTYEYTLATNKGDTAAKTWAEIVVKQPKLKNHKDVFKYIGFTETEEDEYALQHMAPDKFQELTPRLRRTYLSAGKILPQRYFTQLSTEEQNLYLQACMNLNTTANITASTLEDKEAAVVATSIKNHPEWGLSGVADLGLLDPNAIGSHYRARFGTSSVLKILLLLKFNSKYYIDNNLQAIPRKDERLQPLKYFINKYLLSKYTIPVSEASKIYNIKYKKVEYIVSAVKLINNSTIQNTHYDNSQEYSIIAAQDANYMLANIGNKPYIFAFDTTFNLTHKPAQIQFTCSSGFVINDSASPNSKLAKFNEDGSLTVTPLSPEQSDTFSVDNNFIGTYSLKQFMGFAKNIQARIAMKHLKAYEGKSLFRAGDHRDIDTELIIDSNASDAYERREFILNNLLKNSNSKFIDKKIAEAPNMYLRSRHTNSPVPLYVYEYALTFFLCKSINEEVFNYFKEKIYPSIIKAIEEYYSISDRWENNTFNVIRNNKFYTFKNDIKASCLVDLNTFEIIACMSHIIDTKNNFALGESKRGIPKIALAINKDTLEFAPKDIVTKIQDTFNSMSKLRGAELADTVFTTFLKHNSNPSALLGVTSKTDARLSENITFPLFNSRAQIKYGKSATLQILTQNNPQLQAKYLNIVASNVKDKNSFNTLMNICKKHGNMGLAAVYVKFMKSWGSTAQINMGYLFLAKDINVEDALNQKLKNSMFIELQGVFIVPEGVDYNALDGWQGRRDINLGAQRQEAFASTSLKCVKPLMYVRNLPNIIKGKTTSVDTALNFIKTAKDTSRAIKAHQMLQQIGDFATNDNYTGIIEDLYNSAMTAKNTPTVEEDVLPFGLYYKIIDSL